MVLQRVEMAVNDGQEAALEAALCEVRQRVFMSRGFRGFTVFQSVERPSTYLVHVFWETPEELLEFADSGRFERCWAPCVAHRPTLTGFTRPAQLTMTRAPS